MTRPTFFPYSLESERLILRCYEPQDAPDLLEAVLESKPQLRPWLFWAELYEGLEDAVSFVRSARGRFDMMEDLPMGIFRKADDRFLGGCGFHRFDWGMGQFEIGYWLRSSETGYGYATEAADCLTRYAFEKLDATRIEIWVEPENKKSRAIPERLGYVLEGVLRRKVRQDARIRDYALYSMIRDDR